MSVIFIQEFGAQLSVNGQNFKIVFIDRPAAFVPAGSVSGILIESQISITRGAFELIRSHMIPVYWVGYKVNEMQLLPTTEPGTINIRRAQFKAQENNVGCKITVSLLKNNMSNKIAILKRISRYRPKYKNDLAPFIHELEQTTFPSNLFPVKNIKTHLTHRIRDQLLGIEANFTKKYYEAIRIPIIDKDWEFNKRSRRPGLDAINLLLNYGYAILQSQLSYIIRVSGLDIYAGFFHADKSNRISLVLDIIEVFRQLIDQVILKIVLDDLLSPDDFTSTDEGIEFSQVAKQVYIEQIFTYFHQRTRKKTTYQWMMQVVRNLCQILTGDSTTYKGFYIKGGDPW
jgi:CRISP-associated protein Cas1